MMFSGSEDWMEVGFEYIVMFQVLKSFKWSLNWHLQDWQASACFFMLMMTFHISTRDYFGNIIGKRLLVCTVPVRFLFSAVALQWLVCVILQGTSWFWFCPICWSCWCCRSQIPDGWPGSSWSRVDCCLCWGKQEETNWNEAQRPREVGFPVHLLSYSLYFQTVWEHIWLSLFFKGNFFHLLTSKWIVAYLIHLNLNPFEHF